MTLLIKRLWSIVEPVQFSSVESKCPMYAAMNVGKDREIACCNRAPQLDTSVYTLEV